MKTFTLHNEQEEKFESWKKEHDVTCPLKQSGDQIGIGGRFTYNFTPTGVGVAVSVACACGETIDLTEIESW